MNPQEQARQAVIHALGALTLQGIEQQVQIVELQAQLQKPAQPDADTAEDGEQAAAS
jgi:hypothetical protein